MFLNTCSWLNLMLKSASGVSSALPAPEKSRLLPYLPQYTGNQLHRKHWRGCLVRSVHLFGSVSPEAAAAQGMLPMFWTGYCGGYSWWASVTRSHSQGTSPDVHWLLWHGGDTPAPRFPRTSAAAIPWLSNTQSKPGELQLWCVGKSWVLCWGSFPDKWAHVFSPQPPSASQTYNTSCLWKNLTLPPNTHNTAWNLLLSLFWYQVGLFVYFGTALFFFFLSQLTVTQSLVWLVSVGYRKHGLFYAFHNYTPGEKWRATNVSYSAFCSFHCSNFTEGNVIIEMFKTHCQ